MTLGMLSDDQVVQLKDAGLDYYNHNIDTSERYYSEVIKTRTFADRLDTLARVRDAGIKVCSGGIVGMGEKPEDRIDMLVTLANLAEHPESVPINMLIAIPGTPLENAKKIDPDRFRAHHRHRPHHDAGVRRAPVRGPHRDERRDAGALLLCRRQLDLRRRDAAHRRQSRARTRTPPSSPASASSPWSWQGRRQSARGRPADDGRQHPAARPAGRRMSDSHERALKALERRGRLRALGPRTGVDFSSNDYLGLAASPELAEAVTAAVARGVERRLGRLAALARQRPRARSARSRSRGLLRRRSPASTSRAASWPTTRSSRRSPPAAISSSTTS